MLMFIRLFRKKNIEKKKQKIYWTIGLMDQQKNYLLHYEKIPKSEKERLKGVLDDMDFI